MVKGTSSVSWWIRLYVYYGKRDFISVMTERCVYVIWDDGNVHHSKRGMEHTTKWFTATCHLIALNLLSVYFSFLPYCLAWFYSYKFHFCLPIPCHGLWKWFMFLTLFIQLTYLNVIHRIVRLYYYGFLVNEGIGLILVIQTWVLSTCPVWQLKSVGLSAVLI